MEEKYKYSCASTIIILEVSQVYVMKSLSNSFLRPKVSKFFYIVNAGERGLRREKNRNKFSK